MFQRVAVVAAGAAGEQLWQSVCTDSTTKAMPFCNEKLDIDARVSDYVKRLPDDLKPGLMTNGASAVPDLNIPMYQWGSEGLHGPLQPCVTDSATSVTKCPTSFPAASASATSFNDTLFSLIGRAIGIEARAINNLRNHTTQNVYGDGLDYWSPTINMQRDPRWGRNQEVPGEDPTLTSRYAENYIKGIQGGEDANHVQIVATCKHFIANSLENWMGHTRHNFDAKVPADDLADYYAVAFKACVVDGGALGIMCSYNAVNGIPMCANTKWLQNTLRDTWKFPGYVTSDCGAIQNIYNGHSYRPDAASAAAIGVTAGTDVDCGGVYKNALADALNKSEVTMAAVDLALSRLTKMQMKLGLFDNKAEQPYFNYGIDKIDSAEHQQLALEASKQSIVLLKNKGVLPLKPGKSIAVVGPHMNATEALISNYHGSRCANNKFDCIEAPIAAITSANAAAATTGALGCSSVTSPPDATALASALETARAADTVIIMAGIDQSLEREGLDRITTNVSVCQQELIDQVLKLGKPTVLVLVHGGTISLGPIRDAVPAIVDAFYGGEKASAALASVLFGETNPSGRMAATAYPVDYVNEIPLTEMAMKVGPGRTHLYYKGTPEVKFGDGLSYSTFFSTLLPSVASSAAVDAAVPRVLTFNVSVTHVAGPAGKHTLLAMWRPVGNKNIPHLRQKLFDYGSVILERGETAELSFALNTHDALAFADTSGNRFVNPGDYEVFFLDGEKEIGVSKVSVQGDRTLVEEYAF